MKFAWFAWLIVAGYFVVSLSVGLMFTRRTGRSTDNYFLAGRIVPWWLAGIFIVATTFASDTPLLVTGITARGGIAGNWIWWAPVLSGMLAVLFFAKLWRRSGVTFRDGLNSRRASTMTRNWNFCRSFRTTSRRTLTLCGLANL